MEHEYLMLPRNGDKADKELIKAGYTPLLAAVLEARGITSPEDSKSYLARDKSLLFDPFLMNGMKEAVDRLNLAFDRKEPLAVYGDYDVDGISSSCLLCDYFRSRGNDCVIYIPDRIEEGYGVNKGGLQKLCDKGVKLVVTVDCGITAVDEVRFASTLGIDMIITDHHECPEILPLAAAVIDPKRSDSTYPFDGLAGVGVAFKLVEAIEGRQDYVLDKYSDLAALGTIADVMPLSLENRSLVYCGLEKIKNDPRPGIQALLEESGAAGRVINTSTVSFSLAPRINAAGRLCSTETAVKLMLSQNIEEAREYAKELCELNRKRQALETEVWEEASGIFENSPPNAPIVLAGENWHPGVVGIAASRLTEAYHLPAIIICLDGDSGKGSCRSYGDFNLFEALTACSSHLESFGGHAFAAGVNIRRDKVDDFREALAEYYETHLPESSQALEPELLIEDMGILDLNGVNSLELLEPCGEANCRPLMFTSGLTLESINEIGMGKHLRMRVSHGGHSFDCVYFGHKMEQVDVRQGDLIDLCFRPQINDFRGNRSVQLLVSDIRPSMVNEYCSFAFSPQKWTELSGFRPDRTELGRIWRTVKTCGGTLSLIKDKPYPPSVSCFGAVRLCLGLRIFEELGLLKIESRPDCLIASLYDSSKKNALENSQIFRSLWNI